MKLKDSGEYIDEFLYELKSYLYDDENENETEGERRLIELIIK